jgi:hypothetical protein
MDAALNSQSLETLQLWLAEALLARHSIATAKKPYHVTNAGQSRTYNFNNLKELDKYVADLQNAISAKSNPCLNVGGPIHYGMGF